MDASAAAPAAGPPQELTRHDEDGVALLMLNRPQARNALSAALVGRLSAVLHDIAADRGVRAVVIAAPPGPCFSAGHDLKEVTAHRGDADRGRRFFEELLRDCAAMMQQIVSLPQPVIAAVEGLATAAGCQLVASCDLAVAGARASFCTPGVHIGLFCSTPMVALSRVVPRKAAMEMLLSGEPVSAEEALRLGLVNRVVAPGEALAQALALARQIAAKAAPVVAIGKRAFYAQAELGLADAYRLTARVMAENMLARDAEEGIGAFIAKRPPRWSAEPG